MASLLDAALERDNGDCCADSSIEERREVLRCAQDDLKF